jgi:hypothetical protein
MGEVGIRIAFINRKNKIKAKCAWCGKEVELFGWIRDKVKGKEGLACEGCIKAEFFADN